MRILLFLLTLSVAAPAVAQTKLEGLAGAGLSLRHTTSANLAEIAGAAGYSDKNDVSPGSLGFDMRAGVLLPVDLELDATGTLAAGGLALSDIERRYFSSEPETVGSSLAAGAYGSIRYAPELSDGLRLLVGPSAGAQRLAASSPAGSAHLDLLGVGLDAGFRLRLHHISRVVDGHLELLLSGRRELPLDAHAQTSADNVLFSGTSGSAPAIWSFGLSAQYVFSFHAKD
ncbi:MAG: hypothetical protein KC776_05145 [Myxococcales bacterium]|nr:hypothetical protein [Myxococcales bacterium]MCB9575601.1 hypothetical protein [Polyangiaceae bacterium]